MAAVTLLDELSISQPKLRAGIIKTLVESVMLQDRVPYITTGSKQATVAFLSGIPTVGLRFLNESVSTVKAAFSQLTEVLSIIDTDIDIDPVLLDEKNQIVGIQTAEAQNVVASIGYRMNDLFINADPTSDAREPSGLAYKLASDVRFAGQSIDCGAVAVEADFRPGGATEDEILHVLHCIDQARYRVDNKASAILSNQQFVLAWWANLRKIKMFDTTKDQFDREVSVYKGTPILDVGFKPAGAVEGIPAAAGASGDQIIGHDIAQTADTNELQAFEAATRVYVVRFGENHLAGLQQTPMRVKPMGETDASPHYVRTNIRWVVSPCAMFQKRSAARLNGIAVTTTPA